MITVPDKDEGLVPLDDQSDLGKRASRACKRAGVEPVTFHQLRNAFASHLAKRVPLPIVGAVLGHADPNTTARYAHAARDAYERAGHAPGSVSFRIGKK